MATINDISKMVGVSKATVSRAINGKGQVSAQTKKAIFDAMEALNFRPNYLAQALATSRSNTIGLVLSDFDGHYFGQLLKEVSLACDTMGKQLIVTDGHNDVEREREAVQLLVARRCDVIILYTRNMSDQEISDIKSQIDTPLVVIGRALPNHACYCTTFDQEQVAVTALNHLLSLGHKRIVYVGPKPATPTTTMRRLAFFKVMKQAGVTVDDNHIVESAGFSVVNGYEAGLKLNDLKGGFTAVFAASDDLAIGVIKALQEKQIDVPGQVSVMGIDNGDKSAYITPALTTIDLPIRDMARYAMSVTQQLINGDAVPCETHYFKGSLVKRESTSPLKPN